MKQLSFPGIKEKNTNDFYQINNSSSKPLGYYFLSNDVFKIKLKVNPYKQDPVFIGIANPHFFHVIEVISQKTPNFKQIIAVDSNISQLKHFKKVRRIIIESKNRIEFIENLFKIKINNKAKKTLKDIDFQNNSYIHGAINKDKYFEIEKNIWKNSTFYSKKFYKNYGIDAKKTNKGLIIKSKVIGGFDSYYATILSASTREFELKPFTLSFGFGFLRNEKSFRNFKKLLKKTPIYYINSDISKIYQKLIFSNKYSPILFWASNLTDDYFIKKHKPLEKIFSLSNLLGSQKEPHFPEIDLLVLQDERVNKKLKKEIKNSKRHKRKLSIHSKNFQIISKHISGEKNIEVVNMKEWIKKDKGVSKLYKTDYMYIDDFISTSKRSFDTIFLHILYGHGTELEKYEKILKKAKKISKKLLILEHNKESKDFKNRKNGITPSKIRKILGKENVIELCPGDKINNRNLLLVYKK